MRVVRQRLVMIAGALMLALGAFSAPMTQAQEANDPATEEVNLLTRGNLFDFLNTDISGEEIRAAYLLSVMRYLVWPNENELDNFTIGVLGPSEVYQQLTSAPLPLLRGKPVRVIRINRPADINQAQVVYIAPRYSRLELVFNQNRGNPVLLVTENNSVRPDMMINLISRPDNRLSFQINTNRIEEAGIRTTGDILSLRGNELDIQVAQRRAQQATEVLQRRVNVLTERLTETERANQQLRDRTALLEQAIRDRDNILQAQRGSLEDQRQVLDSQQRTLNDLLQELEEQRQLLVTREDQLESIQEQLQDREQSLRATEAELAEREQQLRSTVQQSDDLAQRIAANRDVLATQQQLLRDQRTALDEQTALLASRERTIDRQRDYLLYIFTGFLIALLLGLLSLLLYTKKRKTARQLMQALNELHEAQDKLVESEKMAALGNLVAGVAHEVNTPLGVALTATSMLNDRRELLNEKIISGELTKQQLHQFIAQAEESLSLTEKNLSRVARLISNFKQVAVDQMVTERRTIVLHQYIGEIMSALSIELKRANVSYSIDIDEKIEIDTIPGAMAQVFTNLVTNSIRHGYQEGESGNILVRASRADGDRIKLQFVDDGIGMDNATLEKIFEPFFTTKRNQGGTGLGMPIVYNLVRQQLRGDISVSSKQGSGTTFTLLLPRRLNG